MSREQQQHRITLVRRGIVGGAALSSLGLAVYLGTAATSSATTATTDTGTGTGTSSSSGTTHATSSGS